MDRGRYHPPIVSPRILAVVASTALLLASASVAAHPFGTTSINRYLGIERTTHGVHIAYVLDFAELPAVAELSRLDRDGDGAVTPAERDAYLAQLLPQVTSHWQIRVEGRVLPVALVQAHIEAPPGQNGLSTLRVLAEFEARLPPGPGAIEHIDVHDDAFAEHPGYREIRGDDSTDAAMIASDPPDRPGAAGPPRTDEAHFTFRWRRAPAAATAKRRTPILLAGAVVLALILALAVRAVQRRKAARS